MDITTLRLIFADAIRSAPTDLFEGFDAVKDTLLKRSTVSHNSPFFYNILDSLINFKKTGAIITPEPYPLITSCITYQTNYDFQKLFLNNLITVNLECKKSIVCFLKTIGLHGIIVLSGLRHTVGTNDKLLPPPTDQLELAFNAPFNKSGLTHGGRALSKHSVRDSSKFWGYIQGTPVKTNEAARKKLDELIRASVWHNVLALPHDSYAYEIRNAAGYGARWEFIKGEPLLFRGFVEPPMEDGHAKKWRH